jgi:hypothetical protein
MSSKHTTASRLLAVFALATLILTTIAEAQPYGPGQGGGMMGGGYGPGNGGGGYGPGYGMMGDGYGPGMMGGGFGPGYGNGYGPGMMNGYGPGYHGQRNYGGQVNVELTPDNVKNYFEHMIAEQGNPRLTVGDVKEKDANIITADIVTKEGNVLVQRFAVDRHKGFYRPEEN